MSCISFGAGVRLGEEKVYKDKLDVQSKEEKCTRGRVKIGQEGNAGTGVGR